MDAPRIRNASLVPGVGTVYFYFLTNPSLLIKWRLENNLTSLMSGHEFYCYCILINFIVLGLVDDSLPFPIEEGSSILFLFGEGILEHSLNLRHRYTYRNLFKFYARILQLHIAFVMHSV